MRRNAVLVFLWKVKGFAKLVIGRSLFIVYDRDKCRSVEIPGKNAVNERSGMEDI